MDGGETPKRRVPPLKTFALRTWPNGEFGIGYIQRFSPAAPMPKDEQQGGLAYSWTASEIKSIKDGIGKYGSLSTILGSHAPVLSLRYSRRLELAVLHRRIAARG